MVLVGSWARGNPHQVRDIDLFFLSDLANEYRRRREWLTEMDFRFGPWPCENAQVRRGDAINIVSVRDWLKKFLMTSRSEPTPKKPF
jgi:hypothetical protein